MVSGPPSALSPSPEGRKDSRRSRAWRKKNGCGVDLQGGEGRNLVAKRSGGGLLRSPEDNRRHHRRLSPTCAREREREREREARISSPTCGVEEFSPRENTGKVSGSLPRRQPNGPGGLPRVNSARVFSAKGKGADPPGIPCCQVSPRGQDFSGVAGRPYVEF